MTKTLLLLLILLLALFMAFIPHIGYAYPLHGDEWTHLTYAKTISQTGAITFPDPFTGEGISAPGKDNVWVGYHILLAVFQKVTGIDWLLLFRFGPSVIFMLTVLCVYIFANKQGYGLEAAFFTCLIPTTGGLLGPAFMVPMSLGLLFIPLSLYIAFYVKSWPSYLLLLLIACFLWLMHPTTAAVQGIILLPFILISLISSRGRCLGLLAALLLPMVIALPFTFNKILPAAGQLLMPKAVFPPPYLDLPALLQIYGFIPLIFCFLGIIYLLKRGGRINYGLLLSLVLLLVIMLAFARFQVGMDTIFVRGVSTALLLIGIIAGSGLFRLRTQIVSARFLDKYKPHIAAHTGGLFCALCVVVILSVAIPPRFNVPYYHMIDAEDYRAFVWIRDNIGPEYETALVDPWKATAFTAVTGKKVPRRIWEKEEPIDNAIYDYLTGGCKDTAFIRDIRASFIYNRSQCNNPDLAEIRDSVFLTNPNIAGSYTTANLIKNSGFELLWGNPPGYWGTWSQHCKAEFLFPEPARNGGACVAIRLTEPEPFTNWPQASWAQQPQVQAGQSYIVSGWMKTENVSGQGGAKIITHWRGLGNTWITDTPFMNYIKGTTGWTFYQGRVIAPPGATTCTVGCHMIDCSGKAWYDDISFKAE
jgi:hypothetical protein